MSTPRIALACGTLGWLGLPLEGFTVFVELGYGSLWTACFGSTNGPCVLRFDNATGALQARIALPTGSLPFGICCVFGRVWITDQAPIGSGLLRSIDPATNTLDAGAIATGSARGVVADTSRIWVGCHYTNTAVAVDPATRAVIKSVAVGATPFARLGFDGQRVYVPCFGDGTVWRIDTANGDAASAIAIGAGSQPWGVRCAPGDATAWVTGYGDSLVRGIDTATGAVGPIYGMDVGGGAHDPVPIGDVLAVTQSNLANIIFLDLANNGAIIGRAQTGYDPAGQCFTGDSLVTVIAQGNMLERRLIKL